jgi:hypothetical protein
MSNALRPQIEKFAADFASQVMKAIRGASLEDILEESQGGRSHAAAAPVKRGPGRPRGAGNPAAASPTRPAEVAKPKKTATGRLARRSPEDIKKSLANIVALLKKKPGLRSEAIRAELKMDRKELPRVIAEGLSTKALSKKGEKRATVYKAS